MRSERQYRRSLPLDLTAFRPKAAMSFVEHVAMYINKCSATAEMCDRARTEWAEKWGRGCCAHFCGGGGLGPYLTQCGLG